MVIFAINMQHFLPIHLTVTTGFFVQFMASELRVREDLNEPVLVCVQLRGGDLMQSDAEVLIATQADSATGKHHGTLQISTLSEFTFTSLSITADLDYTPTTAALILPAQSPSGTSRCVITTIIDDDEMEERESFIVSLSNLTPNVITVQEGENLLTVLILDDDSEYTVHIPSTLYAHSMVMGLGKLEVGSRAVVQEWACKGVEQYKEVGFLCKMTVGFC